MTHQESGSPGIDELCARLERAWIDRRDPAELERLAAEHPEHAAELDALFAALVVGSHRSGLPAGLARQAAERNRLCLAAAEGERRPFVNCLAERIGRSPEEITERIDQVSWEFLVQVGRFPSLVHAVVRQELAARIHRAWNVPVEQCLRWIETSPPVTKVASRDTPYPLDPTTFDELLERSGLDSRERSYWLGLAP